MRLAGRDIVCVSTHYWDDRWFRKQEFMSRFSQANRVLYVEPSFSMVRQPEDHLEGIATNRSFVTRLERRGDRLHLLKPPRGVPKWNHPQLDRLTYRWYGRLVRRAMKRLGFRDAILWVYTPSYYHALDAIPHAALVFDLVDDLGAYAGEGHPRAAYDEASVEGLVRRSDLLVVTAKTLEERYGALARRLEQIPNGFDASLFSSNGPAPPTPPALAGVRRPILGFIGTFFVFIDYELLARVARAHPDKSLVLVGRVEATSPEAVAGLAKLRQLPNVVYAGWEPRSAMPAYLRAFDVCLNPFRTGRVADSVNPLKVYEYLAMGRPVVSTPMTALEREAAGRFVHFARDAEEFSQQIEHCLSPEVQAHARAGQNAVAPYSWDRLFERLDAVVGEALAA